MAWRSLRAVFCAVLVVLGAGAVTGSVSATATDADNSVLTTEIASNTVSPNPQEDVLGWENGMWYNESLSIDQSNGLNETELAGLLDRSMARIERLRELEFQRTPTVMFLTRAEYRQLVNRSFSKADITQADRLHQNTKFEALFLVGEESNYFEVARQNQGGFAKAFFVTQDAPDLNLSQGDIGIILDGGSIPKLNETTLAHELAHAVQDQHFNTSRYTPNTEDTARAINGLIEGDAHYVEALYQQRCRSDWDCATVQTQPEAQPRFANAGLVMYQLMPYGDGPAFVQHVRQQGGWKAVNALYDAPPATAEQVIHPETYPDDTPVSITITDTSNDQWHILQVKEGINYATFGEAGLFTMLWYPSYLQREDVIIGVNAPFTGSPIAPYDFAHHSTDGWDGDKLLPYVTDASSDTGETGYVWKLAWDTMIDAGEFTHAYRQLLAYWNAEQVDQHTFRIPALGDGKRFSDAIYMKRTGTTLVIVNAPTVDQLSAIRSDITVDSRMPTSTSTPRLPRMSTPTSPPPSTPPSMLTSSPASTPPSRTPASPSPPMETPTAPGFTITSVVVALLLALVVAIRMSR